MLKSCNLADKLYWPSRRVKGQEPMSIYLRQYYNHNNFYAAPQRRTTFHLLSRLRPIISDWSHVWSAAYKKFTYCSD